MGNTQSAMIPATSAFRNHKKAITCMALSQDGSLLATGSDDTTVILWATKSGGTDTYLGTLEGHNGFISSVAIANTFVFSGSSDNTIRKWDMTTCECLFIYRGHHDRVLKVMCTDNLIFSASCDKTVKMWNFNDAENEQHNLFREFRGHMKAVNFMIFIPPTTHADEDDDSLEGAVLVTGSADGTARTWNIETGNVLRVFAGHKDVISSMAIDPSDARYLITGACDNMIIIWNITTGKKYAALNGHERGVVKLIIADKLLISGSQDGEIKLWEKECGDCTRTLRAAKGYAITALKLHKKLLYVSCANGFIKAFNLKSGEVVAEFTADGNFREQYCIDALAIVDDKVYGGSSDGVLYEWPACVAHDIEDDDHEDTFNHSMQRRKQERINRNLEDLVDYLPDNADSRSMPDLA